MHTRHWRWPLRNICTCPHLPCCDLTSNTAPRARLMSHHAHFPNTKRAFVWSVLREWRKVFHLFSIKIIYGFPKFVRTAPRAKHEEIKPLAAPMQKNKTQFILIGNARFRRLTVNEFHCKITNRHADFLTALGNIIPFQTAVIWL